MCARNKPSWKPRRQQDHRGVLRVRRILRRQASQRRQQRLRIVIDRRNAVIPEHRRKNALQNLAVRQHVRHAARHTQVIFQHRKATIRQPHQIRPADAHVRVPRHIQPAHLSPKMLAAVNQLARHNPFGQNPPFVINVPQEQIQRRQPLRQPFFDLRPLMRGNDARNQVVGENPLGAFLAPVHREGDAFLQKRQVCRLLDSSAILQDAIPAKSAAAPGNARAAHRAKQTFRRKHFRMDSVRA